MKSLKDKYIHALRMVYGNCCLTDSEIGSLFHVSRVTVGRYCKDIPKMTQKQMDEMRIQFDDQTDFD